MPTATQVADWIIRISHDELGAPVDAMSLEKLIYYAQCFYLSLHREPLFRDEIRAWRFGPVVQAVYDGFREHGAEPIIPTASGDPPRLGPKIEFFLCDVIGFFGRWNALQLSKATHVEDPWITARKGYDRHENSDVLMPIDTLRAYYCSLMAEGESALSQLELLDVVPEPKWASFYVAGISYRRMLFHPFYQPGLAKHLSESVAPFESLSLDFYSPITRQDRSDLVEFKKGEDPSEVIRRAVAAK